MVTISASFVVITFAILSYYLGVISRSREAISIAQSAGKILRDNKIEDGDKEKILQRSSLRLFGLLGMLLFGSAIALLAPFGLLWVIEMAGYPIIDETLIMLQRWEFLVGATVVGFIVFYYMRQRLP